MKTKKEKWERKKEEMLFEWKKEGHKRARKLQIQMLAAICLLIIVLTGIGWIGWSETQKEIENQYLASAEAPQEESTKSLPTITEEQTEVSPSPTPSETPSETPSPSASPPQSIPPTPIPKESAIFAAKQHFITLAMLTAIAVLFPWVLLLAFIIQRMPRLRYDIIVT